MVKSTNDRQNDVPQGVTTKLCHWQQKQKKQYDKSVRPLFNLEPSDVVRQHKGYLWNPAIVVGKHFNPDSGTILRRNKCHLRKTSETPPVTSLIFYDSLCDDSLVVANEPLPLLEVVKPAERCTRSGHIVRLPLRYHDDRLLTLLMYD